MLASCIAGNNSLNRKKFANILHKSAPFIFLPFFTLVGASLKLSSFLDGLWFALYLVFFRTLAIYVASFITGKYIFKQSPKEYQILFMTLIPQAGTLLGLVGQLSSYGDWAVLLSASVVTSLLINNLIGLRML
jgi:Kef-type K+ transport system membrane component KefB